MFRKGREERGDRIPRRFRPENNPNVEDPAMGNGVPMPTTQPQINIPPEDLVPAVKNLTTPLVENNSNSNTPLVGNKPTASSDGSVASISGTFTSSTPSSTPVGNTSDNKSLAIILGVVIPVSAVLIILGAIYFIKRRKSKKNSTKTSEMDQVKIEFPTRILQVKPSVKVTQPETLFTKGDGSIRVTHPEALFAKKDDSAYSSSKKITKEHKQRAHESVMSDLSEWSDGEQEI